MIKPLQIFPIKLIGVTYISKEEVLELTEKLQLNGSQFIKLEKLFAQQKNIMILGPVPENAKSLPAAKKLFEKLPKKLFHKKYEWSK